MEGLADRLVFNVENTSLANGSMWNVLQSTPQLLTSGDKLTVKGETPIIFINDKKVYLTATELQQLLETTPATHIKSVEVITNPPAKYDAEGGAVINIVMSKNLATGYNGSINGQVTYGEAAKYLMGSSHFYKTSKVNFYTNYSYSPREDIHFNGEDIRFLNQGNQLVIGQSEIDRSTNR